MKKNNHSYFIKNQDKRTSFSGSIGFDSRRNSHVIEDYQKPIALQLYKKELQKKLNRP